MTVPEAGMAAEKNDGGDGAAGEDGLAAAARGREPRPARGRDGVAERLPHSLVDMDCSRSCIIARCCCILR